jgi:hypothetical protein
MALCFKFRNPKNRQNSRAKRKEMDIKHKQTRNNGNERRKKVDTIY